MKQDKLPHSLDITTTGHADGFMQQFMEMF